MKYENRRGRRRLRWAWIGRLALLGIVPLLPTACAGQKGTIGAVLAQDKNQHLFVREVPDGLAADRAGLEVGDEILLIDGHDARAMSPAAVHDALSGEVGEPVKLTLIRGGNVVRVTVKRTPARKHRIERTGG
jgi:carboxyl-terminal processing protease